MFVATGGATRGFGRRGSRGWRRAFLFFTSSRPGSRRRCLRSASRSIEHVAFIKLDLVQTQHPEQFGLEVLLLVMLRLLGDVPLDKVFL